MAASRTDAREALRADALSKSYGTRRALQAVSFSPAVLLLDEPSTSLDPRQRERLWEFVSVLARERGTTVVYSTHNVAEAERYGDRLLVLADGELLFAGTPDELERATGEHDATDFEGAFVRFLRSRG